MRRRPIVLCSLLHRYYYLSDVEGLAEAVQYGMWPSNTEINGYHEFQEVERVAKKAGAIFLLRHEFNRPPAETLKSALLICEVICSGKMPTKRELGRIRGQAKNGHILPRWLKGQPYREIYMEIEDAIHPRNPSLPRWWRRGEVQSWRKKATWKPHRPLTALFHRAIMAAPFSIKRPAVRS